MITLSRTDAISRLISLTIQGMSQERYLELLADHWPPDDDLLDNSHKYLLEMEIDEIDVSSLEYLRTAMMSMIEKTYKGITNLYIEIGLSQFDLSARVTGDLVKLKECNCCGYLSLISLEYDICDVCGWESDMTSELNEYSSPNRTTLLEAKMKYIMYGHLYKKHPSPLLRIKYPHRSELDS